MKQCWFRKVQKYFKTLCTLIGCSRHWVKPLVFLSASIAIGIWTGLDSQFWKTSGPGSGFKNFGTGAELGFEKVTPATFAANIEKAYQEFCKSLLFAFKQWIPRGCRKNYLQCWEKECKTLYCSFFQVPAGTNSDRAIRPCFCGSGIKGRSNGEKLSISSTSCNPTTRHGAPSINLQAGLHASLACAAS